MTRTMHTLRRAPSGPPESAAVPRRKRRPLAPRAAQRRRGTAKPALLGRTEAAFAATAFYAADFYDLLDADFDDLGCHPEPLLRAAGRAGAG